MAPSRVLLDDAEAAQLGLDGIAAGPAAGLPGGEHTPRSMASNVFQPVQSSDVGLGPTRAPALQNFHYYIGHVEGSPRHHTSLLEGARGQHGQGTGLVDPPPRNTALHSADYLNVETVDYVNAPDTRWTT